MTRLVTRMVRAALVLLLAAPVHAGLFAPCASPSVSTARVQVFLLPGQAASALTADGARLATIMQRHVLFAALKYDSIAVVELAGDPSECDPQRIAAQVRSKLSTAQAAIFVSTRLFQDDGALYLQNDVTLWPAGGERATRWTLASAGSDSLATRATFPALPISFPPRRIPLDYLARLADAQRSARLLHERPAADAATTALPDGIDEKYAFEVLEARPGWMRVRLADRGQQGWLPVDALATAESLKGEFAELYFVDGVIGFLQLAPAGGAAPSAARREAIFRAATRSLDRYLQLALDGGEANARALAQVIAGLLELRRGPGTWDVGQLRAAEARFALARATAPASSVAQNYYLACGAALCAVGLCVTDAATLHAQALEAIASDPTNGELLANLDAIYAATAAGRLRLPLAPAQLQQQRQLLRDARAAGGSAE